MNISKALRTAGLASMVGLLAVSGISWAQSAPPQQSSQQSNGGWHRVGETNPNPSPAPTASAENPGTSAQDPQNYPQRQPAGPPPNLPGHLTIQPGTYITVRLNQALSSDHNQPGDAFSATLVRPIVVDGVVVAASGQTLDGRVTEAKKAGRVEGTSKLGIQLTYLPVIDGQQVPVQAQLIERHGDTSVGRDAAAIGTTTGIGAAIGAGFGGGPGAAVGAGAGLVASTIGVLFTRGHPTILQPESVLTFRIEQPLTISTERAPQAFRYVDPSDYQQSAPRLQSARPGPGYGPPHPVGAYYGPGYYPPYGYYGYGYGYPYYGPSIGVVFGGGHFYGGGRYHGRFH